MVVGIDRDASIDHQSRGIELACADVQPRELCVDRGRARRAGQCGFVRAQGFVEFADRAECRADTTVVLRERLAPRVEAQELCGGLISRARTARGRLLYVRTIAAAIVLENVGSGA